MSKQGTWCAVVATVSACMAHGGLIENQRLEPFLIVDGYTITAEPSPEGDILVGDIDRGYAALRWRVSDGRIEGVGAAGSFDPFVGASSGYGGTFDLTQPAAYRFFGRLEGMSNSRGIAEVSLSAASNHSIHNIMVQSGATTFDYSGVLPAGRYNLALYAETWAVSTFGEPTYDVTFVVPEPAAGLGAIGGLLLAGRRRPC